MAKKPKQKKPATKFGVGTVPAIALCLGVVAALLAFFYRKNSQISTQTEPSLLEKQGYEDGGAMTVVDIPGKGKGVLAARDVKQGERILLEKPLFTLPHEITSSPRALMQDALSRLSDAERKEFFSLSYVHLPPDVDPEVDLADVALATFQTNAVFSGDGVVGIFPRFARLNHGCSSAFNVVYSWREKEGALAVHALKDIKTGEELLTTYTNTKRPRKERQEFLQSNYDFHCTCSVCSLPDELSAASDKRLSKLTELYAQFSRWGDDKNTISGEEATKFARMIWKVGDEEGYWSERGQLAADATWVAAAHSDAHAVRSWANLAIKWWSIELGADSSYLTEVKVAAERPELHSGWGRKEKMAVHDAEDL